MTEFCPNCNAPLDFDEVDIGVGVQRGNYRCPECGWVPADSSLDQEEAEANDEPWP